MFNVHSRIDSKTIVASLQILSWIKFQFHSQIANWTLFLLYQKGDVKKKERKREIDWNNKNQTEIIELWNTKYKIDIIFIYQSADAYLNNVSAERQQSSWSQK